MSGIWAIARLTFSEGMRMKIVLVFLVVLVFIVLRLPFALSADGTQAGRLQTFLAYSLGAVSLLLGVATVFLSCSTLSQEIRNRSIHLVITKPVSRLTILVGKWLGVNMLNLMLIVMCGLTIYAFARFIKSRPAEFDRDAVTVRDVVWTARAAATPLQPNFREIAERNIAERIEQGSLNPAARDAALRERMKELRTKWLTVEPGYATVYEFENLVSPEREDEAMQVRFKARGIPVPMNEIVKVDWVFVDPDDHRQLLHEPFTTSERAAITHQFLIRGARVIKEGRAALMVGNPVNPQLHSKLFFEGDDAIQIYYKVGGFEQNYIKALLIVFFRLGLLSAVGLFLGTFVSFPVACLGTFAFYLISLASPFILDSIGANMTIVNPDIDAFGAWGPQIRTVLVPALEFLFPDFQYYDGARHLVDGTLITNTLMIECLLHVVIYAMILVLVFGLTIFRAREIAGVTV